MSRFRLLAIYLLLSSISTVNAQKLSSRRWNDCLIIIMASDPSNSIILDQTIKFKKSESGLKERKIVIYRALPDKYQIGLNESSAWETSGNIYESMKETNSDFEIVLIGLDGGIKLRREELLTTNELFGVIDQMPMRRAELDKKN